MENEVLETEIIIDNSRDVFEETTTIEYDEQLNYIGYKNVLIVNEKYLSHPEFSK